MKDRFPAVVSFDKESGLWTAEVPDFEGCVTSGPSFAEVVKRVREAAQLWVEAAEKAGEPVPQPSQIVLVDVTLREG